MHTVLKNERGISLVEVVASLLLISIILISFYGLFIQSKKTGKTSEEIVDATYIAQETMEYMYSKISELSSLQELATNSELLTLYNANCDVSYTSCIFTNLSDPNITVEASDPNDATISKNLINVTTFVNRSGATPVIMEAIWRWK